MESEVPVVVADTKKPPLDEPAKKAHRGGPKWEVDVKERLRGTIKKVTKPLQDLVARDANEGDTRLLVTDFLTEGLGYDKYADLTTEYQVKGEFADYGLRIDKDLIGFIETKRVATKLAPKHLRQVEMYAVNEGVEWLILTNGIDWQVYHLTGGLPVVIDLAMTVNLLDDSTIGQKTNQLFYLTKESLKRRQMDELWKAKAATAPKPMAKALLSATVISALRRELRKNTGQNIDEKELERLLRETILRPECF